MDARLGIKERYCSYYSRLHPNCSELEKYWSGLTLRRGSAFVRTRFFHLIYLHFFQSSIEVTNAVYSLCEQ